jgi:hypothetical protein
MGQEGFQYWPAPRLDADMLKGRGPLLTDVDWAREHGYGSRLAEELEQARLGDPNCDGRWHGALDGYFIAYDLQDCYRALGSTTNWDSDWGNSSGPFQGDDTNHASSILQKGTSRLPVKVYNGTGDDCGGGFACLSRGELYASDLSDGEFDNGLTANDSISSHRWVPKLECFDHFVK